MQHLLRPISISKHALKRVIERFDFEERGLRLREKILYEIIHGRRLSVRELMKRRMSIGNVKHIILFKNKIYVLSEDNFLLTVFLDNRKMRK